MLDPISGEDPETTQIFSSKDSVRRGLKEAGIKPRAPHQSHGNPSQARYGQKILRGRAVTHFAE